MGNIVTQLAIRISLHSNTSCVYKHLKIYVQYIVLGLQATTYYQSGNSLDRRCETNKMGFTVASKIRPGATVSIFEKPWSWDYLLWHVWIHIMICYIKLYYETWQYFMSFVFILYIDNIYIILYHIISHYIILYYIKLNSIILHTH